MPCDPLRQWLFENRLNIGLIWFLNTIVGVAVGLANYPYIDDVRRQAEGVTNFALDYSRWGSEISVILLNGSSRIADLGLASFFLSGVIVTIATAVVLRTLFPARVPLYAAVASVIIGINPWGMELWSFRFDTPFMFLSFVFSVLPFLWWGRWWVFTPVAAVSVFVVHNYYQQTAGIFLVMTVVLLYRDVLLCRRCGLGLQGKRNTTSVAGTPVPAGAPGSSEHTAVPQRVATEHADRVGNDTASNTETSSLDGGADVAVSTAHNVVDQGQETPPADVHSAGEGSTETEPSNSLSATDDANDRNHDNTSTAHPATSSDGARQRVWAALRRAHRVLNSPWGHAVMASCAFVVGTLAFKYESMFNPEFTLRPQAHTIATVDEALGVAWGNAGMYLSTIWTSSVAQWQWLASIAVIGSLLMAVWVQRSRGVRWMIGSLVGTAVMIAIALPISYGILLVFTVPALQQRPRYGGYCIWFAVAAIVLVVLAARQIIDQTDAEQRLRHEATGPSSRRYILQRTPDTSATGAVTGAISNAVDGTSQAAQPADAIGALSHGGRTTGEAVCTSKPTAHEASNTGATSDSEPASARWSLTPIETTTRRGTRPQGGQHLARGSASNDSLAESVLRGITATSAVLLTGAFLVFGWCYATVLAAEKENFEISASKLYADVGPVLTEQRNTLCVNMVAPSSPVYISASKTYPILTQLVPTTRRVYFPTTMWFNQVNHSSVKFVQCYFDAFRKNKQDETTPKLFDRPDRTVWYDDNGVFVETRAEVIVPDSDND